VAEDAATPVHILLPLLPVHIPSSQKRANLHQTVHNYTCSVNQALIHPCYESKANLPI
jgi:hypothetical protein